MKFFRIKIIFILLIVLTLTSCKKKEAFIFYLNDFYTVFDSRKNVYESVKKELFRDFFRVHEVRLKSQSLIATEMKRIASKNNGFVFLESYAFPLLLENGEYSITPEMKALTYNIPENISYEPKALVFNIQIDERVLDGKLFSFMKSHSAKKDLSDVLLFFNGKNYLSKDFAEACREKNPGIELFEIINEENYNGAKNRLRLKDKKVIIFFAGYFNKILTEKELFMGKKSIYAEVQSDFWKINPLVTYNVIIDWEKSVQCGLASSDFRAFVNSSNEDFYEKYKVTRNIYNYKTNAGSAVSVKRVNWFSK
jgi:hypothetical protein